MVSQCLLVLCSSKRLVKLSFSLTKSFETKAVEESKRIQNKINGTDEELPGKLGFEPHDTGPLSESRDSH